MNRMDHKVCVIAGPTKDLGAAIARRLAAAGAVIVVTGRNEDRGDAVAEGIAATSRVPTLFVRRSRVGGGFPTHDRGSRRAFWAA